MSEAERVRRGISYDEMIANGWVLNPATWIWSKP